MMFSLIIYVFALLSLLGIVLSFILAYRTSKSQHILALLLFFIAVFFLELTITYSLLRNYLGLSSHDITWAWTRAILLFSSTMFLLYTTWKK